MREKPKRTEGNPHDRMTRMSDRMLKTLETDPEYADSVKAIVMLHDEERGGIGLHGYERDTEAMADLLVHLRAVMEANGKTLIVAPIGGRG